MVMLRWCLLGMALLAVPALAEVRVSTVERGTFEEVVQLDGLIEAVQQSTVSAQTSGKVMELPFDVDDSVPAGALIARLEDSEQQSRLAQAEAGLEEDRSGLSDARQRFRRIDELYDRGLVSRQEYDQANNNLASANARVERARSVVEEAEKQLSYTRVEAPYGGIVTERHVEIGEAVSPGQPLISGLSLEQLRVVVDLPQKYAGVARDQRRARVTLDDGRAIATGEMTFYPYANPGTHTFRVRMSLTEPNGTLFPGMLVKVSVPVSERQVILVPESSVIHRSELRAVFVMEGEGEGRPRLRQVRTGGRQGGQVEILAGLSEGERLVVNPQSLVGTEQLAPRAGGEE